MPVTEDDTVVIEAFLSVSVSILVTADRTIGEARHTSHLCRRVWCCIGILVIAHFLGNFGAF